MDKLKIAGSFLKIKFHNIFSVIVKAATGYIVGSFATIQLSSIVVDNVSTQAIIGMPSETFMQYLFIALLVLFPVVLIIAFITKKKSLTADSLSNFDEINSTIDNQKPKIGVIPFENLNENSESGYLVDGIVEDLITELSMVNEISIATRLHLVSGVKTIHLNHLRMNGDLITLFREAFALQMKELEFQLNSAI